MAILRRGVPRGEVPRDAPMASVRAGEGGAFGMRVMVMGGWGLCKESVCVTGLCCSAHGSVGGAGGRRGASLSGEGEERGGGRGEGRERGAGGQAVGEEGYVSGRGPGRGGGWLRCGPGARPRGKRGVMGSWAVLVVRSSVLWPKRAEQWGRVEVETFLWATDLGPLLVVCWWLRASRGCGDGLMQLRLGEGAPCRTRCGRW